MKFSGRFHQQVCAHLTFTVIIVFMILQTRRSSSKFHPYLFVRNNCGCCEKKKKKKRKSRLRRQSTTAGSSYIPAVHRSFNEPLKRLAKRLREGKPRHESETTGTVFKLCARLSTLQRLRENSCFAILSLPCRQQIAVIHINPAFTATSKRDRWAHTYTYIRTHAHSHGSIPRLESQFRRHGTILLEFHWPCAPLDPSLGVDREIKGESGHPIMLDNEIIVNRVRKWRLSAAWRGSSRSRNFISTWLFLSLSSPLRKKERKRKRGEGEKSGKGDRGETLSSISGEEGWHCA